MIISSPFQQTEKARFCNLFESQIMMSVSELQNVSKITKLCWHFIVTSLYLIESQDAENSYLVKVFSYLSLNDAWTFLAEIWFKKMSRKVYNLLGFATGRSMRRCNDNVYGQ